MCRRCDGVVVLTDADRRRLERLAPGAAIHVVPTGVDLAHFSRAAPRAQRQPKTLIYVGHYQHYPNEDAALWFAREVLPLLWERDPGIRFEIVGTGPTEALMALARRDGRIVVTGAVPDVRDCEERAIAMVAPLRLGQGIKGKILEGMAAGAPVVATPLANEGIRAEPGRQILLAKTPREFCRQVLRVVEDAALWETLSAQGRAFVQENHSWKSRADQLDAVYRGALKTSRQTPKLTA
jgi:glycosyltransferase involved in cell wall biosynthesis